MLKQQRAAYNKGSESLQSANRVKFASKVKGLLEATTGIEPVYTVLQTVASPLRHVASMRGNYRETTREAMARGQDATFDFAFEFALDLPRRFSGRRKSRFGRGFGASSGMVDCTSR